jgi:cytochrome P450
LWWGSLCTSSLKWEEGTVFFHLVLRQLSYEATWIHFHESFLTSSSQNGVCDNCNKLTESSFLFSFLFLAREYGDVVSVKVFNQTIIIVNTPSGMREVLDKRNSSSSNRPYSWIADQMAPNNVNFGTAHKGLISHYCADSLTNDRAADETWWALRKAASLVLNASTTRKYEDYQYAEVAQLLRDFLHDPEVRN